MHVGKLFINSGIMKSMALRGERNGCAIVEKHGIIPTSMPLMMELQDHICESNCGQIIVAEFWLVYLD
jgi:hypothetical protein